LARVLQIQKLEKELATAAASRAASTPEPGNVISAAAQGPSKLETELQVGVHVVVLDLGSSYAWLT
jgi:hypothetical protein